MQRFIFSLLIFLLPTQLAYHFWPDWAHIFGIRVDYLAPTIYTTDILIGLLAGGWVFRHRKLSLKPISIATALIFAFISLNIVLAKFPEAALFKWAKVLEIIFFGYYVAKTKELKAVDWIFKPLAYSLILFSLIGISQFLIGKTIGGPAYYLGERSFNLSTPGIALVTLNGKEHIRLYSTFPHPNAMAGYLAVSLVLTTFSGISKKLKLLVLVIGGVAFILTFSLGAYLALIVSVSLYLAKVKKIISIVIILVLITIIFPRLVLTRLDSQTLPETVGERLVLMDKAENVFAKSPLVGVGLNNFYFSSNSLQPVHNIFLLVLSETGIIGLVLFLCLLFGSLQHSLEINNWKLIIPVLVIIITGLADHYWLTLQQNQLLLGLIFGLSFRNKI